jgi:hypothetical protein
MIDWAAPLPDRDTALAKVKAELRAEQRRLTDVEVDLIANVAIELRMSHGSLTRRSFDVQPRQAITSSLLAPPKTGVDESSSRS